MTDLPLFFLSVLAILATPGPTNTLLATAAASVGVRRGLPLLAAEISGYLISVSLLILVGRPMIALVPGLDLALRVVLVAYLLLLAWRLWNADPSTVTAGRSPIGFRQVFTATLLNPKGMIFAFVICPVFESVTAALPYAVAFSVTVVGAGGCWLMLGAALGRAGKGRAPRMLPRACGVLLGVIACVVAGSAIAARM